MTSPYFSPVNDLIVDAAINAIDDLRAKGYADHDSRAYFMSACGAAFDANIAQDDADPEGGSAEVCPKCGGTHVRHRNGDNCAGPPLPSSPPSHMPMG